MYIYIYIQRSARTKHPCPSGLVFTAAGTLEFKITKINLIWRGDSIGRAYTVFLYKFMRILQHLSEWSESVPSFFESRTAIGLYKGVDPRQAAPDSDRQPNLTTDYSRLRDKV